MEYYDLPKTVNRSAVVFLPTEAYLRWAKSCPDPDPDLTLDELREEGTVFLIPEQDGDPERWLRRNFKDIFAYELNAWYTDENYWPEKLTYKLFTEFFDVQFCFIVLDMGRDNIESDAE